MPKTKKSRPVVETDQLDYPKHFKKGNKYIKVNSKASFVEVHLSQTLTRITSGSNIHTVQEASIPENATTEDKFTSAMKSAIEKIVNTK